MLQFNATFIVAIISFVLFIIIMNLIFYKPILSIIEKRKKYINDNYNIAEKYKNDASEIINLKNSRIANADKLAKQIVAEKTYHSSLEAKNIIKRSKKDAQIRVDSEKSAILDKEKATDISNAVSEISDDITKKLLGEI